MCTTISESAPVTASAKGPRGWFGVDCVHVGYDHPFHVDLEHALSLDFVDEQAGPDARVAVEMSRASARALAERILDALEQADAYEAAAGS